MKRIFSLGVLVVGIVLVLGGLPAAAAQGDLAGRWTSIDTDGSHQTLTIEGSGERVYAMSLFDESATSLCDGAPASVNGPGRVTEDGLLLRGAAVCRPGGNVLRGVIHLAFTYDAGTDTLTDEFGVVWSRA